jgi:putative membrane protein
MKFVFRSLGVILFIVFFGFALKNTDEVTLRFFLNYEIKSPLVLLLLGFFAAGAVLGVLAMTPTVFRHRRELSRHKKAAVAKQKESDAQQLARVQPPPPDSVVTEPHPPL